MRDTGSDIALGTIIVVFISAALMIHYKLHHQEKEPVRVPEGITYCSIKCSEDTYFHLSFDDEDACTTTEDVGMYSPKWNETHLSMGEHKSMKISITRAIDAEDR